MARRQHLTATIALGFLLVLSITYLFSDSSSISRAQLLVSGRGAEVPLQPADPKSALASTEPDSKFKIDLDGVPSLPDGDSIAPKMENATLKAELGRATWKFLHTMVSRFPEKPTESDRQTLDSFFRLFGRLYPCGDCARHFRQLLEKYPPQTSSRNAAAGWLCAAHNMVNKRLDKPQFDCTKIGDFYDCGCGDDKKEKADPDAKGGEVKKATRDAGHEATFSGLGGLERKMSKIIAGL